MTLRAQHRPTDLAHSLCAIHLGEKEEIRGNQMIERQECDKTEAVKPRMPLAE